MASEKTGTRRQYSEALKAQVVAECDLPGASVAKVAMAHGINANVVHRWRQLARQSKPFVPGGTESALARVVNVFGEARPHHAYLFANKRANRAT